MLGQDTTGGFFETGSPLVTQTDLELTTLLPLPPWEAGIIVCEGFQEK